MRSAPKRPTASSARAAISRRESRSTRNTRATTRAWRPRGSCNPKLAAARLGGVKRLPAQSLYMPRPCSSIRVWSTPGSASPTLRGQYQRYDEARRTFEAVISEHPNNIQARFGLAQLPRKRWLAVARRRAVRARSSARPDALPDPDPCRTCHDVSGPIGRSRGALQTLDRARQCEAQRLLQLGNSELAARTARRVRRRASRGSQAWRPGGLHMA